MATKITVTALVNAHIEKVWDNWTKPQHITKWNFAVDDWQCPKAENDLKVGGKYFARMETKDNSFGFDFEAIYDVVNEKKEFIYTMSDGRKATTIFESNGSETNVTTTFDAETENPVEMQQEGWQMILNNFKKYAETN
ncbi:MAG: activator of HSP90 ATPase [Chitinophagaceae bacterium]|nr:MAG: activator of HSP90 ATPase [Chitinophagaceae bacterium]